MIDVTALRVEDLYSNFDRSAPYIRRDLDQNLVDYLIECAEEIGRNPFVIRFSLEQPAEADQLARVKRSISGYFEYMAEVERARVRRMARTSLLLMIMGFSIFALAIWIGGLFGEARSVAEDVIAEGLTVAAWVALWEALAKFMVEWPGIRASIRCFRRLAAAPLVFETRPAKEFPLVEGLRASGAS